MSEAQPRATVDRLIGILAILGFVMLSSLTRAEPLTQCRNGLRVLDIVGNPIGQVVGDRDGLCVVKSRDGRLQRWVPVGELSAAPPEEPTRSRQTSEPEPSAEEPASAKSDETDTADKTDTAVQSEWLEGFPTLFHGRPFAAKRRALRHGQFRESRKASFSAAPVRRSAPAGCIRCRMPAASLQRRIGR